MIPTGALEDIRVLDLSQGIAGPLCAKILGDFGAEVIKVEPLAGEPGRRMGPFFHDDPDPEKSAFFLLLNLNKRGVTLNLETPKGGSMFKELVKKAQVVVESFPPDYLASLGLDYENLEKINPGIVVTSITPFGQSGPYSHYKSEEIVAYATSGLMSVSGTANQEPLKHGGFQSQYEAGLNGALATAYTLLLRDMTGQGQHVDVSIQEVVASTLVTDHYFYSWAGDVRGRQPAGGSSVGYITPCKDGYFVMQMGGQRTTWDDIVEFLGREELKEPRFSDPNQRIINSAEMDKIVLEAVKDRTKADLFRSGAGEHRLLLGIDQTPEDLANCPQLESREFFQEIEHPIIGKTRVPFRLFGMTATPASYRTPAPLLGQHNAEVYGRLLGYSKEGLVRLKETGII